MSKINLSRRNLIRYGGGFVGTGLMAAVLGSNLANSRSVAAETKIIAQNKDVTPDEALKRLIEGNERFVEQKSQHPNQTKQRLMEVSQSQAPFAAILSCADSRVPSEIVFDQGIGDLFVVRNAGNTATPEEFGSLEFGTLVLGAKVLMVIGHERCGAVMATMKGGEVPGQIGSVIDQIEPAIKDFIGQQDNKDAVMKATEANVLYQIEKLSKSPVLSKLIEEGKLKIVGGYYDLDTGKISLVG